MNNLNCNQEMYPCKKCKKTIPTHIVVNDNGNPIDHVCEDCYVKIYGNEYDIIGGLIVL